LNEIIEGKTAYDQVVHKDFEGELVDESKKDILSKTCDDNFYYELPHMFILLDEAINILTQKIQKTTTIALQEQTTSIHYIHMCARPYWSTTTSQT
jgi:hypothetical protein